MFWSDLEMHNHCVSKKVELRFPKSQPSTQFVWLQSSSNSNWEMHNSSCNHFARCQWPPALCSQTIATILPCKVVRILPFWWHLNISDDFCAQMCECVSASAGNLNVLENTPPQAICTPNRGPRDWLRSRGPSCANCREGVFSNSPRLKAVYCHFFSRAGVYWKLHPK